jgi:nitroimidazol reductase NimA-like FMN-containing flavoprotein (pyridoxamine 5'-phosphate oxidase superfamily)
MTSASAGPAYAPTELTKVRRRPERASYDRELVHSIIDEAIVCHVSFVYEGQPCILPTTILRVDEDIYLHGSPTNRMLCTLAQGARVAIAVTHIDAVVAGRSGFGCSVDYRSVVVYSAGTLVEPDRKAELVERVIQSVVPGHRVRPPKQKELDATLVLRFPILEVSAKVRDLGVRDYDEDLGLDLWAGSIPLRVTAGTPVNAPGLRQEISTPAYALNYRRGKS